RETVRCGREIRTCRRKITPCATKLLPAIPYATLSLKGGLLDGQPIIFRIMERGQGFGARPIPGNSKRRQDGAPSDDDRQRRGSVEDACGERSVRPSAG